MSIEIWRVDLDRCQLALEEAERASSSLSDPEVVRGAAISAPLERARWRTGHIALRLLLERTCGPPVKRMPFGMAPGGRPELDGVPVSFSLSHSGDVALIAIGSSARGPIGIDVECTRVIRMSLERRARLEDYAMQLAPHCALPAVPDSRLLQSWVRIEAYAKASGEGVGMTLTAAGVIGSPRGQAAGRPRGDGPQRAHSTGLPSSGMTVRDLDMDAGYYGALAAPQLPETLNVKAFPWDGDGVKSLLLGHP